MAGTVIMDTLLLCISVHTPDLFALSTSVCFGSESVCLCMYTQSTTVSVLNEIQSGSVFLSWQLCLGSILFNLLLNTVQVSTFSL